MPALYAVLFFALWTHALLIFGVGLHRWRHILTGRARITDFPADQPHGPPLYQRITRAHANCIENLPVFAAIVFCARFAGYASQAFDALALLVCAARVAQSLAHISSGSERAVAIRFSFFAVQLMAMLAMSGLILAAAL